MSGPSPTGRFFEPAYTAGVVAFIFIIGALIVYVGQGSNGSWLTATSLALFLTSVALGARWVYRDAQRIGLDAHTWGRYALWFPLFTWVLYLYARRRRTNRIDKTPT